MPEQIKNRNFLNPVKFDFNIDRLPNTNFFVQSANIPGLSLPPAANVSGTPFSNIPWQGDRVTWDDLTVEFSVDENLRNWYEIYKWMTGIGFTQNLQQYADLKQGQDTNLDGEKRKNLPPPPKIGHIYGQASLIVRSSHQNAILEVKFNDVHPVSLSELKFDTTAENTIELKCTAVFKYTYYTVSVP